MIVPVKHSKELMKRLFLASAFMCATAWATDAVEQTLYIGTIQFPSQVQKTPSIRVYCAGKKLSSMADHEAKRVTFCVPEHKQRTFFYLLVVPPSNFKPRTKQATNTVECWTINPEQPYHLYALELQLVDTNEGPATKRQWHIQELQWPGSSHQLPDETIIVCYPPEYIKGLEGGSTIELPKIMIKDDVLVLAGSEEKLHQISDQFIMCALDTDALHAPILLEVQDHKLPKTIIAMNR